MELEELYQRLAEIFCEVFNLDEIELKRELIADDVEGWDSLGHIRLLVSIERAFGIKFSSIEIDDLQNLGEFVDVIKMKTEEVSS